MHSRVNGRCKILLYNSLIFIFLKIIPEGLNWHGAEVLLQFNDRGCCGSDVVLFVAEH